MPDIARQDLSKYRLEKAEAVLITAHRDWNAQDYASANNRAYYSLFHAMRAVLALDGMDFKSHSAVIARFSEYYLKSDKLPRAYGKLISNASRIRNRSDYEDFYICSIEDTRKLLDGAEEFLKEVSRYIASKIEEQNMDEAEDG